MPGNPSSVDVDELASPHNTHEKRLRVMMDAAVDGVILIDATGTILLFNAACERLFGYDSAEVIGRNVDILMPSPFREGHNGYLEKYRLTGLRNIIGMSREVVGIRKDRTTFRIDLSVGQGEEDGQPVFVGIIHDPTERDRQQHAGRDASARLRAVVDTAVDGVMLIDSAGSLQMFNPACERLFGYAAAEVIGRNVKMLMPSPYAEHHDQYLANYVKTREAKIIGIGREVVGRRKDGSTFPMHLSVGEARQDGESNFVGIIHDLTERKRTEEQLVQAQKMESVGQLSGGIAHDFNNLLTVIIGNSEMLKEKLRARPDLAQICDSIMGAGERGAELTRRLLAFSRRQTLKPKVIDCNALVEGLRVLLRRTLREDVEIRTTLEPNLIPAFADLAQLESAVLNLALNAQDAMPHGGTLTIATSAAVLDERYQDTHPEVIAGDYVVISVTDDGEGMTEEISERVFEPFFTTKDVGKGSGLGLSMVYGFIKQSNGHVAIYSAPGLGTTVRLYLPLSESAAVVSVESRGKESELPRGSGTILVVEDDQFVREYAVGTLEGLGYKVITAVDGRDAMTKLNQGIEVDLLFSDVVMPGGINGWELADRARQQRPDLKVLLTSGYSLETMASRSEHGAELAILDKPYRKVDLARRLREIFDGTGSR
jgi:PAS domain S-box-containing protein